MTAFTIRPASSTDAPFIVEMLVEAVSWHPEHAMSHEQILADPSMAHYVNGWMRPNDFGVVAVDANAEPIGAAWSRYFTASDRGYGYVKDGVPELSVAVVAGWRGRGVGRALLDVARARGVPAVSLSVERANFAARLYAAEGFRTVESFEHSDTMMAETGC